jgi:hypothetical protein
MAQPLLLGRLHVKAQSPPLGPWGIGPQRPAAASQADLAIEPARPAPAHLPAVSLEFIGARAGAWSPCLLFAMLLIRNVDPIPARSGRLAPLAFDFQPASCAAFLRTTSLVHLESLSSLLSEGRSADLKQSGLRRSVPYSATQNLAYLPCRMESYVSTFRFFVGGVVSKKNLRPREPHDSLLLTKLLPSLRPHARPVIKERSHVV